MDVTSLFSNISLYFAIFLIASLSGMFSERSGVINIAIEGYMIIGALVYSILGSYMDSDRKHQNTQIIAMLGAMVVCGLFSVLQSYASIRLKANQIISGTAINILAQGIGLYLSTASIFGDSPLYIDSNYIVTSFDHNKQIFTLYLLIAIFIAAIIGVYFTFTKFGKWHISAGENPNALDSAGISVIRFRWGASTVSGMLAGLAGAMFVVCIGGAKFNGTTNGYGFLALAIMIVGRWRTSYVTLASLVFALFFALSKSLGVGSESSVWLANNSELVKALPFVVSLLVMVIFAKWSKPPKADGIPFDKSKR